MDKYLNILTNNKNIIEQIDTKFKLFKTTCKQNIDSNQHLVELLDLLVSNKNLIKSIYFLKKKIISFMNELYVNYDIDIISKYYYDIFGRNIHNLIKYNSYCGNNNNNSEMIVKYIQHRSNTQVEKQQPTKQSNTITLVII
jgi:hypothetical protein